MSQRVALFDEEHDGQRKDGTHTLIDHTGHGVGQLEGIGAQGLIRNSSLIINPCQKHPLNEIQYLDKTTKTGACEVCLPGMLRANHELLPIRQTVNEVT